MGDWKSPLQAAYPPIPASVTVSQIKPPTATQASPNPTSPTTPGRGISSPPAENSFSVSGGKGFSGRVQGSSIFSPSRTGVWMRRKKRSNLARATGRVRKLVPRPAAAPNER